MPKSFDPKEPLIIEINGYVINNENNELDRKHIINEEIEFDIEDLKNYTDE